MWHGNWLLDKNNDLDFVFLDEEKVRNCAKADWNTFLNSGSLSSADCQLVLKLDRLKDDDLCSLNDDHVASLEKLLRINDTDHLCWILVKLETVFKMKQFTMDVVVEGWLKSGSGAVAPLLKLLENQSKIIEGLAAILASKIASKYPSLINLDESNILMLWIVDKLRKNNCGYSVFCAKSLLRVHKFSTIFMALQGLNVILDMPKSNFSEVNVLKCLWLVTHFHLEDTLKQTYFKLILQLKQCFSMDNQVKEVAMAILLNLIARKDDISKTLVYYMIQKGYIKILKREKSNNSLEIQEDAALTLNIMHGCEPNLTMLEDVLPKTISSQDDTRSLEAKLTHLESEVISLKAKKKRFFLYRWKFWNSMAAWIACFIAAYVFFRAKSLKIGYSQIHSAPLQISQQTCGLEDESVSKSCFTS